MVDRVALIHVPHFQQGHGNSNLEALSTVYPFRLSLWVDGCPWLMEGVYLVFINGSLFF